MDIHKVELHLTTSQKCKFLKGMNFQMTNSQLQSKNGKHKIDPNLSEKDFNDLLNKISKKKSYRFKKEVFLEGSGIFRDISKGLVKIAAPLIIDKVGDLTGTRNVTDAIVKPNANQVIDLVGGNVKKGRFVKGSQEAKDFMQSIRKKKNGGNIFDDIGNKLKSTFTPDLGRKIKDTLTSGTAKQVYKVLADTAIPLIKTQNPILGTVMQVGVDSALGSGLKRKKPLPNIKSSTSNLINGVPQVIKIRNGGSFREL